VKEVAYFTSDDILIYTTRRVYRRHFA